MPGQAEEGHEEPQSHCQSSRYLESDSKYASPEYKSERRRSTSLPGVTTGLKILCLLY
jgi:hypothetical protein